MRCIRLPSFWLKQLAGRDWRQWRLGWLDRRLLMRYLVSHFKRGRLGGVSNWMTSVASFALPFSCRLVGLCGRGMRGGRRNCVLASSPFPSASCTASCSSRGKWWEAFLLEAASRRRTSDTIVC